MGRRDAANKRRRMPRTIFCTATCGVAGCDCEAVPEAAPEAEAEAAGADVVAAAAAAALSGTWSGRWSSSSKSISGTRNSSGLKSIGVPSCKGEDTCTGVSKRRRSGRGVGLAIIQAQASHVRE